MRTMDVNALLHLQAWNLTGDVYSTHPGDKPWISEMYGYSFGAAKANVWHRYHTTAMIYPGYQPIGTPELASKYCKLQKVTLVNQQHCVNLSSIHSVCAHSSLRLLCRGSKGAALWPAVGD
jgi:hypothetical protein